MLARRNARGRWEGGEGSKPSGVCKNSCITLHAVSLHAKNHAREFMQEFARVYARVMRRSYAKEFLRELCKSSCEMLAGIQHAAQGCGGFNRYAHSAVPNLDDLMFGGLEDWKDW